MATRPSLPGLLLALTTFSRISSAQNPTIGIFAGSGYAGSVDAVVGGEDQGLFQYALTCTDGNLCGGVPTKVVTYAPSVTYIEASVSVPPPVAAAPVPGDDDDDDIDDPNDPDDDIDEDDVPAAAPAPAPTTLRTCSLAGTTLAACTDQVSGAPVATVTLAEPGQLNYAQVPITAGNVGALNSFLAAATAAPTEGQPSGTATTDGGAGTTASDNAPSPTTTGADAEADSLGDVTEIFSGPAGTVSGAADASSGGGSSNGLSTGAQAGIGVGVALLVLAIALLAFFLIRRRRKRRVQKLQTFSGPPGTASSGGYYAPNEKAAGYAGAGGFAGPYEAGGIEVRHELPGHGMHHELEPGMQQPRSEMLASTEYPATGQYDSLSPTSAGPSAVSPTSETAGSNLSPVSRSDGTYRSTN